MTSTLDDLASKYPSETSLPKTKDDDPLPTVAVKAASDAELSRSNTLQVEGVIHSSNSDGPEGLASLTRTHEFGFIPIPRWCRYDPAKPFKLTLALTLIFGFGSTAAAANVYYCQPILLALAKDLHLTDAAVASIPTLTQAGYATGLLFITPLGDLVRRRPLLIIIVTASMLSTLGVASAPNLIALRILSFCLGASTVTAQILMPFAADLTPPDQRGSIISIVFSGLILGISIARVIGGLIAEKSSWRTVYYASLGLQGCSLLFLWLALPDLPSKLDIASGGKREARERLSYFGILGSMAKFAVTEPILIQICIIMAANEMGFSAFWVTLTFLLGKAPYNYSTLSIGLFGLVGIFGVVSAPFVGRFTDKLFHWVGVALGIGVLVASESMMAAGAAANISVVIFASFLLDIGCQLLEVSAASRIYSIDPALVSRFNAVFMIWGFVGQVAGSAIGTHVFLSKGYRAAYAVSVGYCGIMLLALLARGPHAGRYTWFGWEGGARLRKGSPTPTLEDGEVNEYDVDEKK